MSRASTLVRLVLVLAITNTILLGLQLLLPNLTIVVPQGAPGSSGTLPSSGGPVYTAAESIVASSRLALQFLLANSLPISAMNWALVAGVWIWRGREKSRWESLGFDSGIYNLFVKMKGAKTRMSLLESLSMPKDRLQLAEELGVDWKAVDYQIILLNKCGLVHGDRAFGKVKMYQLTTRGESLLRLLKNLDKKAANSTEPTSVPIE